MPRNPIQLDQLRVSAPCDVGWANLQGDDRVRHCDLCNLNVYNIAALSRKEAIQLIEHHKGRLCVSLFRRSDGTALTRECPIRLRAWRRRTSRMFWAFGLLTAVILQVLAFVFRQDPQPIRVRTLQPFEKACSWLSPTNPPTTIAPAGPQQPAAEIDGVAALGVLVP